MIKQKLKNEKGLSKVDTCIWGAMNWNLSYTMDGSQFIVQFYQACLSRLNILRAHKSGEGATSNPSGGIESKYLFVLLNFQNIFFCWLNIADRCSLFIRLLTSSPRKRLPLLDSSKIDYTIDNREWFLLENRQHFHMAGETCLPWKPLQSLSFLATFQCSASAFFALGHK